MFLGVDGGGSRTRALVCDATGRVLGCGEGGSSNFKLAPPEAVRGALETAIQAALAEAAGGPLAAFLGMAGVATAEDRAAVVALAKSIPVLDDAMIEAGHDVQIALEGGLSGAPGIALIAGTGSSCYGRNAAGESYECGGWGDLVDDVGSGAWLGLRALQSCVRQADGREAETGLKAAVMDFLRIESMDEFKHRIHRVGLSRPERARLAPVVSRLCADGDPAAGALIDEAVIGLAELVAATAWRLGIDSPKIVLAGGLMADAAFREAVRHAIETAVAKAQVLPARLPPIAGAALLALKLGGVAVNEAVITRLASA